MDSKEVIITGFKSLNENIEFINKYNNNKESELQKSSQIVNWSQHIVVLAISHLNPFSYRRQEKKVLRQQRSYDKMKLSYCHEKGALIKSISSESFMITNKPILINESFMRTETASKSGSYDTICDDCQSDTSSDIPNSCSLSSAESSFSSSSDISSFGSLYGINVYKNCDKVRVIQRFGSGFPDKCLFPLALSLNVNDLTKGKVTWDTILTKADLILNKWEECSGNSKKVNRVFGNPSDFVYPHSSLQNEFLLHPRALKPLNRWKSYEDLQQLSHEQQSAKFRSEMKIFVSTDDTFFTNKEFHNKSPSDSIDNKSNKSREDINQIKSFKTNSSPLFVKQNDKLEETECDAKSLIKSIKLNSPLSLAIQISKIDKNCFLELQKSQLFLCMIGDRGITQNNESNQLNVLLEFGQELTKMVITIIRKEITPETQGKKMAGLIEVCCALRKMRNWHSLCIMIRALQSPKIYFIEEGWMCVKRTYPIHYNDYLKLCRLVQKFETCIISTNRNSIPSIISLMSSLRINCIATWDLLENKRRWTEPPSIARWLDHELIGQLVESQKMSEKQEENCVLSLDESQCSLLPVNDRIKFIHYSLLPNNWTQKDIKFVQYSHLKQIIRCFMSSFDNEINSVRDYYIPNYQIQS